MKPTYVSSLTETQLAELHKLHPKTKVPRLRTRAQMILLSAEKRLKVAKFGDIVRVSDATGLPEAYTATCAIALKLGRSAGYRSRYRGYSSWYVALA